MSQTIQGAKGWVREVNPPRIGRLRRQMRRTLGDYAAQMAGDTLRRRVEKAVHDVVPDVECFA
jgi:hypothetical protein